VKKVCDRRQAVVRGFILIPSTYFDKMEEESRGISWLVQMLLLVASIVIFAAIAAAVVPW